ncbi:MAG: hypothetical protein RIT45_3231 [Pseudomonadota bacterium]|jgi:hypothetical protein
MTRGNRNGGVARWWVALALGCIQLACSEDGTGTDTCAGSNKGAGFDQKAVVLVEDLNGPAKDRYTFDTSVLSGGKRNFPLTLRNDAAAAAAKALVVKSVKLTETDASGQAVTSLAFRCQTADGKDCAEASWQELIPPGFDTACASAGATQSASLTVTYDHANAGGKARKAVLSIEFEGDPDWEGKTYAIAFEASPGQPSLKCAGVDVIDFGNLGAGKGAKETFKCQSVGSSAVTIEKIELFSTTDAPLTVRFEGQEVTLDKSYDGTPTLEIASGASITFEAELAALATADKVGATLRIHSNSTGQSEISIQFLANSSGPCLKLSPNALDFGEVGIGQPESREIQIIGCGTEPVNVVSIALEGGSSADFSLDFDTASFLEGAKPTADAPLVVQPNATETVRVRFAPTAQGGATSGTVAIEDGDGVVRKVELTGKPTAVQCPTACIDPPAPGSTVVPQTKLTLGSKCSKATAGHVVDKWEWSVEQPVGSTSAFLPNNKLPSVDFLPNVAGTYTFKLKVANEVGTGSCTVAEQVVQVVPDNKLHVELTWTTKGDTDPLDKKGSDLDLHLAHPLATTLAGQPDLDGNGTPDPWWAKCYDCFWINSNPQWGDASDLDDNPSVDLDDTDGWGPENLSMKWPEEGEKYWVGVYAWYDNGFGPSQPRIRIYLDKKLVFDKKGPELKTGDMWCVGRVKWDSQSTNPAADIEPCPGADNNGNLVTPNYPAAKPSRTWTCPP